MQTTGWRLGARASTRLELVHGDDKVLVDATWREGGYTLQLGEASYAVQGRMDPDGRIALRIDGLLVHARAVAVGQTLTLFVDGTEFRFTIVDPRRPRDERAAVAGHLASPMPGLVIAVPAQVGAMVERGTALVVIEAMKMEHTVAAPRAGRVQSVNVGVGEQVAAGAELVVLEAI
jgi:3-methylcrotonyl-CoA carboxylase alpha subunit